MHSCKLPGQNLFERTYGWNEIDKCNKYLKHVVVFLLNSLKIVIKITNEKIFSLKKSFKIVF